MIKKLSWFICSVLLSWAVLAESQDPLKKEEFGPSQEGMVPDFSAVYDVFYGDYQLGSGRYELERTGLDEYQFRFNSKMRFMLVFTDKRWLKTDFQFKDHQILASYFWHKRSGTGTNYIDEITFDKKTQWIRSKHQESVFELPYDALVKDGLSVQLQLMLDLRRGLKTPTYKIIEEGAIDERQFSFTGKEIIDIEGIKYDCVVYEIVRDNNKRRTQMWFSPKHNYQPVMMAHYSKEKKQFNARLKTFDVKNQ